MFALAPISGRIVVSSQHFYRWCKVEGGRMPTLSTRIVGTIACLSALAAGPVLAQAGSDGEWTMPGKDYSSTRYSKLAEITSGNATRLHPVWTFLTGVLAGHQGQPLVVKNTMY